MAGLYLEILVEESQWKHENDAQWALGKLLDRWSMVVIDGLISAIEHFRRQA